MSMPHSGWKPMESVELPDLSGSSEGAAWLARYADWESRVALRINRANRGRAVSAFFGGVSRLGDGVFWYLLMAALLAVDGFDAMEPVLLMMLSGLGCTLIYKALKAATSRPRPCQRLPAIRLTTLPLDLYSFPSGHTLHAVCFTLVAGFHYPVLWPWLVPFTLLVAASRLILGLHYVSDVLAGAAIGGSVALGALYAAAP